MRTKNIFKTVALAMLMPAMLLTTACSNDDDAVNNENTAKNGYTLPVTINVSRQDDGTTRSTYTDNGNGTGTFAFGTGDKLFVWGTHSTAGKFAGTLTWTSGTSEGKFSGTITTQNEWTSTADALFTNATSKHATLLPSGYETPGFISITGTGYNAYPEYHYTNAFALTKGAAVEQFSLEDTDGYTGSGFVLSPTNAILNFTITGLAATTEVAVVFTNKTPNPDDVISKNVTTDGSGNAKFAIAIHPATYDPDVLTLTVGGHAITINSTSKEFVAGKIYNVTRSAAPALTYPIALGDATSDYVGSVVTTDGNVYATVAAASAASKTAVAVIAYVGAAGSVDAINASYKGLAIAMSDAGADWCQWYPDGSNLTCVSQYNDIADAIGHKDGISNTNALTTDGHTHAAATAAASNNGTDAPTGTSGWFLPSMGFPA